MSDNSPAAHGRRPKRCLAKSSDVSSLSPSYHKQRWECLMMKSTFEPVCLMCMVAISIMLMAGQLVCALWYSKHHILTFSLCRTVYICNHVDHSVRGLWKKIQTAVVYCIACYCWYSTKANPSTYITIRRQSTKFEYWKRLKQNTLYESTFEYTAIQLSEKTIRNLIYEYSVSQWTLFLDVFI